MAITGPNSYVPTMNAFLVHWTNVNDSRPDNNPIELQGNFDLEGMTILTASIQTAVNNTIAADNVAAIGAGTLLDQKTALRPRMTQFRLMVQALLPGTAYSRAAPTQPSFNSSESKYVNPLEDMRGLWAIINGLGVTVPGFTPPLLLAGGYTLATFTADLEALRTAYRSAQTLTEFASLSRGTRDELFPKSRARMKEYRDVILAQYPKGSAFVNTLPALTPPPGSTPDAVDASGTWNGTLGKAVLKWDASPNPHLSGYSVRTSPGPSYRAKDESVVADLGPEINGLQTDSGLTQPGTVALFKVYVLVETGNERGSATIKIDRPPTPIPQP